MKSKFLYQYVDVVSLADEGIVVWCFVCRNHDKVLMETGKLCDNIRVTKTGLVSGVHRMFKSSESTFFSTSPIDLIHSERVSSSTSSFFAHRLAYASHASMIISKFWCHENETGSLYFSPLRKRSRSLSFRTILRSSVTLWPHGAYRNSEPEHKQGRGFWERLWESICCRRVL